MVINKQRHHTEIYIQTNTDMGEKKPTLVFRQWNTLLLSMFYFALIPLVYTVTHLIASHRLHQSIHQRIRSTNTNHWDFSPSHQHTLVYFGQQRSSSSQTALKRFSCLFGFLYFSLLLSGFVTHLPLYIMLPLPTQPFPLIRVLFYALPAILSPIFPCFSSLTQTVSVYLCSCVLNK